MRLTGGFHIIRIIQVSSPRFILLRACGNRRKTRLGTTLRIILPYCRKKNTISMICFTRGTKTPRKIGTNSTKYFFRKKHKRKRLVHGSECLNLSSKRTNGYSGMSRKNCPIYGTFFRRWYNRNGGLKRLYSIFTRNENTPLCHVGI